MSLFFIIFDCFIFVLSPREAFILNSKGFFIKIFRTFMLYI